MERLDLRFRAEPATTRDARQGRWWLWCLIGAVLGLSAWWLGRTILTRKLSEQLAGAEQPSDAFLALEGLLMLDAEATLEITRGLQHPNAQVARTAYRTLDVQISGWKQLESSYATARMRSLSDRLMNLPNSTPAESLVLAGSLASRIYSICLELDDPQLAVVMANCESVFQRLGQTAGASQALSQNPVDDSDLAGLPSIDELEDSIRPPPPLRPNAVYPNIADPPLAANSAETTLEQNQFTAPNFGRVPKLFVATPPAITSPVAELAPPQPSETGISSVKNSATRQSLSDGEEDSYLLNDNNESRPQPTLLHGPATVGNEPLVRVRKLSLDVDLENIDSLGIDQLVRLLGSTQPRVAQTAALVLRSKEWPDHWLTLASELATSSPVRRIELLQQIASDARIEDPRPWYLWMAKDGEPEVRQQAVALLSSRPDIFVERELRQLLSAETDQRVAQTIRQVLVAR